MKERHKYTSVRANEALAASGRKTRIHQALESGYIERRRGRKVDTDFDAYWHQCLLHHRPFVRIERHRGRYRVEADLFPTRQHFTQKFQQRALMLLRSAALNPKRAIFRLGPLMISCDSVAPEHIYSVAVDLFRLGTAAPAQQPLAC